MAYAFNQRRTTAAFQSHRDRLGPENREPNISSLTDSLICSRMKLQPPVTHFRLHKYAEKPRPVCVSALYATKPTDSTVSRVPLTSFNAPPIKPTVDYIPPPPSPIEEEMRIVDSECCVDKESFYENFDIIATTMKNSKQVEPHPKKSTCDSTEEPNPAPAMTPNLKVTSFAKVPLSAPPVCNRIFFPRSPLAHREESQGQESSTRNPLLPNRNDSSFYWTITTTDGRLSRHEVGKMPLSQRSLLAHPRKGVTFDVERNLVHTYERPVESIFASGVRKMCLSRLRFSSTSNRGGFHNIN